MNRLDRKFAACFIAALLFFSGCFEPGLLQVQSPAPKDTRPAVVVDENREPAVFMPDQAGHEKTIAPFLKQHCLKCHGPETREAGFRVDEHLSNDFTKRSVAAKWSEVLDVLNAGKMPPKTEPRPAENDTKKVVDWIVRERLRGEKSRRGTEVVLRRLNRAEYNNTIRDLTGVDLRPADEFPADPPAAGFDNNGGALTISPLQLELYVRAARRVLERAIVTQRERPATIKWRFELEEGFGADRGPLGALRATYRSVDGQQMYFNPGSNFAREGMTVLRRPVWDTEGAAFFGGFRVLQPGYYTIRMRGAGVVPAVDEVVRVAMEQREQRHAEEASAITDPQRRRNFQDHFERHARAEGREHFASRHYQYGPPRIKLTSQQAGVSQILDEYDVPAPASEPENYETQAWFEPGAEINIALTNVYHIPRNNANFWLQGKKAFPRPELLVDWLEIEGPLHEVWPPQSHQRILIDSPHRGQDEEAYARDVIAHFMRRAYRRPLRDGEVEAKLTLFRKTRPDHESFEKSIQVPLAAVLSSPHFLFLTECENEDQSVGNRTLDDFELACRLSYFLTSSMPDEELTRLAEKRQLSSPEQLIAQADRLLADPRSGEFVKNFAGQWLKLRDVGANPPSQKIYLEYDDHLEASMRGESEAFFAHVLSNDLSVLDFIRAGYVVINERMARFYGIANVKGDHFRVVKVPAGMKRGGVLTQASVLSVTSNGTRTSPVWRGAWILERLLGDPPPPPPPNAGDLPPNVPGIDKATVRDRLRSHREQPQCAHCHSQIDPLGFALENFDASGQWRERESRGNTSEYGPNDPLIDARASLPGGAEFVGVEGLQKELLDQQDRFLKCLAEKLYTYALGRELGYADEPLLDSAVQYMKQNGKTLRSLIHHIVQSEAFRSK